jgi:hypothetical protein
MNYCLLSFVLYGYQMFIFHFQVIYVSGTVRNLSNLKPSIGVLFQLPDFRNEKAHLSLSRFSQFNQWNYHALVVQIIWFAHRSRSGIQEVD